MLKKYLTNKAVNALNIHHALLLSGEMVLMIFGAVFLLEVGLSVPEVLFAWGSILLARIPLRYIVVKLWGKLSPIKLLMIGIVLMGVGQASVYLIYQNLVWLVPFILMIALAEVFYWTILHYLFGFISDKESRGKQIGMRDALTLLAVAGIPFLGGWLGELLGLGWVFLFSLLIIFASMIPLFKIKIDMPPKLKPFEKDKETSWIFKTFVARAAFYYGTNFIWTIVLFLFIGDLSDFGLVVALSFVLQSLLHLIMGHFIDKGHERRILRTGTVTGALQTSVQAVFITTPVGAVITNTISGIRDAFHYQTADTFFYHAASDAKDRFWYHFRAEIGFDVGGIIFLWGGALLVWLGVHLRWLMILGLVGLFAHWLLNEKRLPRK